MIVILNVFLQIKGHHISNFAVTQFPRIVTSFTHHRLRLLFSLYPNLFAKSNNHQLKGFTLQEEKLEQRVPIYIYLVHHLINIFENQFDVWFREIFPVDSVSRTMFHGSQSSRSGIQIIEYLLFL